MQALDTFNTAMVSSVYYIFFTICTITASSIMYKDWENQTAASISWQLLGFLTPTPTLTLTLTLTLTRPPPRLVARQEAFRIRHVVDAAPDGDGPIRVSNLDPDLVADLRASGLSMEEICTHLGLQP